MLDRQALEKTESTPSKEIKSDEPRLEENSLSKLDTAIKKLKDAQISDEVVQQVQAQLENEAKEKARVILGEINQTY